MLWRNTPQKDVGYLIQAESDAYSLAEDLAVRVADQLRVQDLITEALVREGRPAEVILEQVVASAVDLCPATGGGV